MTPNSFLKLLDTPWLDLVEDSDLNVMLDIDNDSRTFGELLVTRYFTNVLDRYCSKSGYNEANELEYFLEEMVMKVLSKNHLDPDDIKNENIRNSFSQLLDINDFTISDIIEKHHVNLHHTPDTPTLGIEDRFDQFDRNNMKFLSNRTLIASSNKELVVTTGVYMNIPEEVVVTAKPLIDLEMLSTTIVNNKQIVIVFRNSHRHDIHLPKGLPLVKFIVSKSLSPDFFDIQMNNG